MGNNLTKAGIDNIGIDPIGILRSGNNPDVIQLTERRTLQRVPYPLLRADMKSCGGEITFSQNTDRDSDSALSIEIGRV